MLQLIYKVLSTYTSGKKSYRSHLLCQYSVVALKDGNVDPYSNNCVATGKKYSTAKSNLGANVGWLDDLKGSSPCGRSCLGTIIIFNLHDLCIKMWETGTRSLDSWFQGGGFQLVPHIQYESDLAQSILSLP